MEYVGHLIVYAQHICMQGVSGFSLFKNQGKNEIEYLNCDY